MPPSTPIQMNPKPSPPYHYHHPNTTTTTTTTTTIKPMKPGHNSHPASSPEPETRPRKASLLRPQHKTNRLIWCGAFLCVIFSLLIILAGIVTLIIFLVIKPRTPMFETTSASLNSIYIDSPMYLNGDLTFLANFSNPNHKIDLMYEYLSIELYFYDQLIAVQALQPFSQPRGEARLVSVHMISSEVYLKPQLAMELQKEVRSNRVFYNIRGTFKVKASLSIGHFSYWLYGRCLIELSGPPSGVLVARSCRTKK